MHASAAVVLLAACHTRRIRGDVIVRCGGVADARARMRVHMGDAGEARPRVPGSAMETSRRPAMHAVTGWRGV